MYGSVFFETLRRHWKQILYWGGGLGLYALLGFALMPSTPEGLAEYENLTEALDPSLLRAFGIDPGMLASPEGFIGYSFFGYTLLIMSVFAVLAGLNITANDEDAGIMDVFLSLPIPRWQIVAEKLMAYIVIVFGIMALVFAGLLIGDQIAMQDVNISTGAYLEGVFNVIPGTLLVIAFTAFVATVVKRRGLALAIAGGFVVVSYVLDAMGRAAGGDVADFIREFSIFAHYDGTTILTQGVVIGSVVLLLVIALALGAGAVTFFQRRDVAV